MFKKLSKLNFELVSTKPKLIIVIALALTIISGVLAAGLSMELSWVSLAPEGSESVKEYQQIIEDFPTLSPIIVLVESDDSNAMKKAVKSVEEEVSQLDEYVVSVTGGLDQDFILDYSLILANKEQQEELVYTLADSNFESIYQMIGMSFEQSARDVDNMTSEEIKSTLGVVKSFEELVNVSSNYLAGKVDKEALESGLKTFMTGDTITTSDDGTMTTMTIQPAFEMMDTKKLLPGVNAIEEAIEKAREENPNVKIMATGMHIVGRDEADSIMSDSYVSTIVTILVILGIQFFAFKAFSAPALTFMPLVLGVFWVTGLTKIFVGRLNMMTAFAAVMLLGLGIDFAIHLYSSYTEKRSYGEDKLQALEHAIMISGPGILTGGLTTAAAFLTLNVSSLALLSELGTVMGLGIITTLVSVFWVLPAVIVLKKEKESKISKIKGDYKWIGFVANTVRKHKVLVASVLLVSSVFMASQAKDVGFDKNLLNLEPVGLESVEVMNYMIEKYDMSSDAFSVSVGSLEEVYRLHKAYEETDGIKEVTSIASFIPEEKVQRERIKNLEDLKKVLLNNPSYREPNLDQLITTTKNNQDGLIELGNAFKTQEESNIIKLSGTFDDFKTTIENHNESKLNKLAEDYYEISKQISEQMLSVELLSPDKLPDNYKKQFVSEDGSKYLITIYPNFDVWENIDNELGKKFYKDIKEINASITGTPIFMKELFDSIGGQLVNIALILMSVLLLILLIHFKSIKYTIISFIPLVLTLIFTVGTMSLLNYDFNMLNFIAILLIIGIGIDDGVHVLHHYKEGQRVMSKLFSSIGRAILITTLTTVSGFGSLAFSSYRGMASLGIVLAIGVAYAFIMTVLVLPILLKEENA